MREEIVEVKDANACAAKLSYGALLEHSIEDSLTSLQQFAIIGPPRIKEIDLVSKMVTITRKLGTRANLHRRALNLPKCNNVSRSHPTISPAFFDKMAV